MNKQNFLEHRIHQIELRNKKVEKEKQWETSLVRKVSIAVVTYFTLAAYFAFVLKVNPWINAIVPTVGFLLSTLSLSVIKNIWLRTA
jgi:hypothetical protein